MELNITADQSINFYNSREWRDARYKALVQNNGKCECCGAGKHDGVQLHVDHIKPRSLYPSLELEVTNLQVLCKDCNLGKSNNDESDWRKAERHPSTLNFTPEQRQLRDSQARITGLYPDIYCAAIAIILHYPEVVKLIDDVNLCEIANLGDRQNGSLLFEMIYMIRDLPKTNSKTIIKYWRGTKRGAVIDQIFGMRMMLTRPLAGQQFVDCMSVIRRMPLHAELSKQVKKLKQANYSEVSEKEKQRLRLLLDTRRVDTTKGVL